MFLDAGSVPDGRTLEADVCVVGTGAAGLAFAREFLGTSTRVVMLECGGLTREPGARGIYRVTSVGSPVLGVDSSRPTGFGGNTNYWAANCRPLDGADFEPRGWIRYGGWPIRKADLLPYYERAQQVCGLPDYSWYDLDVALTRTAYRLLDVDPASLETRIMLFPSAASFADRFQKGFDEASDVRVLLRSQALRLLTSRTSGRVSAIEFAGPNGRARVEARTFVLAAGGVENARLLLCSNDVRPNGIGNDRDLVGRFFMEHWFVDVLIDRVRDDREYWLYTQTKSLEFQVWGQLVLAGEAMKAEGAAGLSLWFPERMPDLVPPNRLRSLLQNAKRRLRGGAPLSNQILRVQIEQTPRPENRICLESDRDPFGQPRASLNLSLASAEIDAQVGSLRRAARALGLDGDRVSTDVRGKLETGQYDFFWHHMGTTRMHDDPAEGVVDRNCRIHGVPNVYVTGSSVFPTSGTAAPTLTIVALALRLADHLRRTPATES